MHNILSWPSLAELVMICLATTSTGRIMGWW